MAMASKMPPGFVELYAGEAPRTVNINTIGLVVGFLDPAPSRGSDWMSTFNLTDSSEYSMGRKVKYFRPTAAELPKIKGTGDVVLLRNAKFMPYQGNLCLLSNRQTSWTVFHAASIPAKIPSGQIQLEYASSKAAPKPTWAEMSYAIELCNTQDRTLFTSPKNITLSTLTASAAYAAHVELNPIQDKFSLIQDVKEAGFFDLVGQIVKFYPDNDRVDLHLTDYTKNALVYDHEWGVKDKNKISRDGDPHGYITDSKMGKKWPGPFGKQVLQVTLWDPHATWAQQNLKEEAWVCIRNVRIKLSKSDKLEGVLHGDKIHPNQVDISIVTGADERVKQVLRRKKEYWKSFKSMNPEFIEGGHGRKRKFDGEQAVVGYQKLGPAEEGQGATAAQRKRMRKRQNKANGILAGIPSENVPAIDFKSKAQLLSSAARRQLNPNIRSNHPDLAPRTLSAVLSVEDTHNHTTPAGNPCTLPFLNVKFRINVRVVDFFPPNLEDFAVGNRSSEYDALSDIGCDSGSDDDFVLGSGVKEQNEDQKSAIKWEWCFALLVEDADAVPVKGKEPDRIVVYVSGHDGDCLLKLDATK